MIRAVLSLLPPSNRRDQLWLVVLLLVGVVLRAASTVLLIPLVSALFSEHPAAVWPWLVALTVSIMLSWGVDWLAARRAFTLGFSLLQHGQRRLATQLSNIRLAWFDSDQLAMARAAVAATGPELVGLFVYLAVPAVNAALLPIAIAFALLPVSPWLGLAALVGVPLLLGAYWFAVRLSRDAERAASESNTVLTERIIEFARAQRALRAARRSVLGGSQLGVALAGQHRATIRLLMRQVPGQLMFSLASQIALLLLAAATVWLTVTGQLTAPEAIAMIVVIVRYLEPFTALAALSAGMQPTLIMLRRIQAVLAAPQLPRGGTQLRPVTAPTVELCGVTFSYKEGAAPLAADVAADRAVLEHLDLRLEAGTTTAIVGPSGSGKSTILSLIAGLHTPDLGKVMIDGVDVNELDAASRQELVSVVFQDSYIFATSLRENMLLAKPDATAEELAWLARVAQLEHMVANAADGWESQVGEAGVTLSGGERQRLAIARALLKPAHILLLDEVTSALDHENEAAIEAALNEDPRPRTRVIVAHRLSTIRAADRVVFLDAGRIVEQGTVPELLAAGGRFAEFWEQQHAVNRWKLGAAGSGAG